MMPSNPLLGSKPDGPLMGVQLPELPVGISGLAYGIAGSVAAIIIIAKLSQGPNVSMAYG